MSLPKSPCELFPHWTGLGVWQVFALCGCLPRVQLATNADLRPKMASVVDARIAAYFEHRLKDHLPEGATLAAYVPKQSVPALHDLFGRYAMAR